MPPAWVVLCWIGQQPKLLYFVIFSVWWYLYFLRVYGRTGGSLCSRASVSTWPTHRGPQVLGALVPNIPKHFDSFWRTFKAECTHRERVYPNLTSPIPPVQDTCSLEKQLVYGKFSFLSLFLYLDYKFYKSVCVCVFKQMQVYREEGSSVKGHTAYDAISSCLDHCPPTPENQRKQWK